MGHGQLSMYLAHFLSSSLDYHKFVTTEESLKGVYSVRHSNKLGVFLTLTCLGSSMSERKPLLNIYVSIKDLYVHWVYHHTVTLC